MKKTKYKIYQKKNASNCSQKFCESKINIKIPKMKTTIISVLNLYYHNILAGHYQPSSSVEMDELKLVIVNRNIYKRYTSNSYC